MLVCGGGLVATKAGSVYFLRLRHLDTSRIHEKEKRKSTRISPFRVASSPDWWTGPLSHLSVSRSISCCALARASLSPPSFPVRLIGQQPEEKTKKRQFYGKLGARNLVPGVSLWNWGASLNRRRKIDPNCTPFPIFSLSPLSFKVCLHTYSRTVFLFREHWLYGQVVQCRCILGMGLQMLSAQCACNLVNSKKKTNFGLHCVDVFLSTRFLERKF